MDGDAKQAAEPTAVDTVPPPAAVAAVESLAAGAAEPTAGPQTPSKVQAPPASPAKSAESTWVCGVCSLVNPLGAPVCSACEIGTRPASLAVAAAAVLAASRSKPSVARALVSPPSAASGAAAGSAEISHAGRPRRATEKKRAVSAYVETPPSPLPAKRRSRKSGGGGLQEINPVYLLGYAEDGETPDMIEKKFEKLEELERRKKDLMRETQDEARKDTLLSDEDMKQLFQETSYFSVRELAAREESNSYDGDWEIPMPDSGDEFDGHEYHGYDDDFWEALYGETEPKKRKRHGKGDAHGKGEAKEPKQRTPKPPKEKPAKQESGPDGRLRGEMKKGVTRISYISDRHGQYVTAVKRIRTVDPNSIEYQPIPRGPLTSWAKIIAPYEPPGVRPSDSLMISVPALPANLEAVLRDNNALVPISVAANAETGEAATVVNGYQAVVINPPWKRADDAAGFTPADLRALNLSRTVLDSGFVFVWVHTENLMQVVNVLEEMGFFYVENSCWVKQHVSNRLVLDPERVIRSSKQTCLMCRRGQATRSGYQLYPVELRHQRTPDVVFDFARVRHDGDGKTVPDKPSDYLYNLIETLLPHSAFNEKAGRGGFLELWAAPTAYRKGWTFIAAP